MELIPEELDWMNESELRCKDSRFFVRSTPRSDFFCSPETGDVVATAPFLYRDVDGDFRMNVRVRPTFVSTYDACSLFVYARDRQWLKVAFELTDIGTHSIVTVATDGYSDDANGVDIANDTVYLQLIRKGDVFVCHYSTDGATFKMARILGINMPTAVRVGVSVQAPTGEGQWMEFSDLNLTKTIPADIRTSK